MAKRSNLLFTSDIRIKPKYFVVGILYLTTPPERSSRTDLVHLKTYEHVLGFYFQCNCSIQQTPLLYDQSTRQSPLLYICFIRSDLVSNNLMSILRQSEWTVIRSKYELAKFRSGFNESASAVKDF